MKPAGVIARSAATKQSSRRNASHGGMDCFASLAMTIARYSALTAAVTGKFDVRGLAPQTAEAA